MYIRTRPLSLYLAVPMTISILYHCNLGLYLVICGNYVTLQTFQTSLSVSAESYQLDI
jgi:hypothetical protein